MRVATVLFRDEEAGTLTQKDDGTFLFQYLDVWTNDQAKPPISLTLPKKKKAFESKDLFPFFFHLLPEGYNRDAICRQYQIDRNDHMGLLLTAARTDVIGAVRIIPKKNHGDT